PEPDLPTRRRVDRQRADARHAVPALRGAPHDHVVGPAAPEDVAHLLAGDQGGRGAADVAGFQPVPRGLRQIDLHLDLRHVDLEVHVVVDDPGYPGQDLLHLVGLVADHRQILTVDPDDDGLLRPGEYLLDALVQVGQDVLVDPRVVVDHLVDGGQGPVQV